MSSNKTNFSIPDRATLAKEIGQASLTKRVYGDYEAIIQSVNEAEKPLAFEHCFLLAREKGFSRDSRSTYKTRVKVLFEWEPRLLNWIVGQYPDHKTWVDAGAEFAGVASVNSSTLNDVQQECTTRGDDMREAYAKASLREFQARALKGGIDDGMIAGGLGTVVDSVMEEVARISADEFPRRIESVIQATRSIAGHSNEDICVRCLEAGGFTNGTEFSDDGDNADLIIDGDQYRDLNIEIKSEASRERASRSFSDRISWVLFAFFTSGAEVRNRMFTGNEQGPAWIKSTMSAYVPPRTLKLVKDKDSSASDGRDAYRYKNDNGRLFLRSNEEFVEDMKHFRKHGELRDLTPGHEN